MDDDPLLDELIPILKAPRVCSSGHTGQSFKRWSREGVLGPDGERIRLGSIRVGGRLFTSRRMITEFLASIQPPGSRARMLAPTSAELEDCHRTTGKVSARTAVGAG